jgi:putative transposase
MESNWFFSASFVNQIQMLELDHLSLSCAHCRCAGPRQSASWKEWVSRAYWNYFRIARCLLKWPFYGYRRLTVMLRREGWKVNAKRIYRLYAEEQLIVRTKQRKKIGRRQRLAAPMAVGANVCWSMDFVSDKLADGRSFRILTAVDQFTRECVWLEADRSMTGMKVVHALEKARAERGSVPTSITVDNGSEFCSRALEAWVIQHGVQLCFIRPGRPVENAFIESFNGRLRDECLNVEWFSSLEDARQKLAKFREHYNHHRPHSALADRTPAAFAELHRLGKEKASTSLGARTPEPLYRVSGMRETRVESG